MWLGITLATRQGKYCLLIKCWKVNKRALCSHWLIGLLTTNLPFVYDHEMVEWLQQKEGGKVATKACQNKLGKVNNCGQQMPCFHWLFINNYLPSWITFACRVCRGSGRQIEARKVNIEKSIISSSYMACSHWLLGDFGEHFLFIISCGLN